ncbi:heat shock 70 kDa protein 12A-like [Glandiceps talaboti]
MRRDGITEKDFEKETYVIDRNMKVKAKNGKSVPALLVFSESLRCIKTKALEVLKVQFGHAFECKDIQWVITVPAIWRPSSRQFMREAAEKADMLTTGNRDQLKIALEPEAASIFCRREKMWRLENKTDQGKAYMVVDCGGGTVDVTIHKITHDNKIEELYKATGGGWGGMNVDLEFEKLLTEELGSAFVSDFQKKHPSGWVDIMRAFQTAKCSDRAADGENTRVKVDNIDFVNYCRASTRMTTNFDNMLTQSMKKHRVSVTRGSLVLPPDVMKSLFQPSLQNIREHLLDLLKMEDMNKIDFIFLVGGFSESKLLQEDIKAAVGGGKRIFVPGKGTAAIMEGAVMFSGQTNVIKSRKSALTYGTDVSNKFDEKIHDISHRYVDREGVERCRDVFFTLVTVGETITTGNTRRFTFNPIYKDQESVRFVFFVTEKREATYTDDAGVEQETASLCVPSPYTEKGSNRKINMDIRFDDTEIKAIVTDVESGQIRQAGLSLQIA